MSKYTIIGVLLACLFSNVPAVVRAAEAERSQPVFYLSFEKGLTPDIGPKGECKWAELYSGKATEPPRFSEQGLTGKALLVEDTPAVPRSISVPPEIVAKIKDSGTILFWVRGLENWNVWGMGNMKNSAGNVTLLTMGGGPIYKWAWYGSLCLFAHGPTMFYPLFDQYQWTQLGVSWQSEGGGKTRNRIYLDGKLVGETTGTMNVDGLRLVSDPCQKGARYLLDELKIYDRVLTESELKRLYRQDGQFLNQPVVSVPRLKRAPVIDGKINSDEWAGAAEIAGLVDARTGEAAVDQSAFYLGYDDKFLYVAMKGDLTEKARVNPALFYEKFLRSDASGRNEKVEADDAVEIVLSPDYWKTDDHRQPGKWKEYRLLANAVGAYSACSYGAAGPDPQWSVKWQTASTVGSAGWQFEARIPLDSFGAAAPAPGDRWGLELGRIWKHLKEEHDVWCWGARAVADADLSAKRSPARAEKDPPVPEQPDLLQRRYATPAAKSPLANVAVLQFAGEKAPVVRVDRIGKLPDRQIDFQATVVNPAAAEQPVKARLFTDTGELSREETLVLPAGGTKVVTARREITDPATPRLTFEVVDARSNLVHRSAVPFYLDQAFDVRVIQYPNYEKVLLELNLGTLSQTPLNDIAVDVALKNAAGETVQQQNGQPVPAYYASLEVSTKGIAPGDYLLSVVVRGREKAPEQGAVKRWLARFVSPASPVLARNEKKFTKTAKAAWWDNRYGYEDVDGDMVPYPWTNMALTNETIRVWGRDYRFGNGLFPEQITTLDDPILRAPMRLVVKTADGAVLDTAATAAQGQWTKTNHTRVEGTRTVAGAGFTLTNKLWAEYDGLLWNTLTLVPTQQLAIASMELEIPLTKEFTDVINGGGCLGKLKTAGSTSSVAVVWLGNGDGGLQLLPGDGKLLVKDPQKAMRVEMGPAGATLRVVLVDSLTNVAAPYEIQFGLIATPVRPKTWRTPEHPFYRGFLIGGGPWFPVGLEFMPAADPGYDFYSGGVGGRIYVHTSPCNIGNDAAGTDDFKKYGYEWLADPDQRPAPQETIVFTTTNSKSYRDYFAWRFWRYQQKYRFAGLYYDNPDHSTLGTRDVMKRLYNIALRDDHFAGRDHIIGMAANGTINMAYMGFVMYHWDGEQLNSAINERQPTYKGLIDPDVYRAEFMGHNFGWTVAFLGQGRLKREWVEANGGPEAVYDQMQGLELLHDSSPHGADIPGPMDQVSNRAIDAFTKLGLSHWVYQFLPYWHQDIVPLPSTNMYASFYLARPSRLKAGDAINGWYHAQQFINYFDKHLPDYMKVSNFGETEAVRKDLEKTKDKAVLIVYNNSDWEGVLRLKPDWQKLGLGAPEGLTASNAVHSTGFRLDKVKNEKGEEVETPVFFPRPEEYARIEGGELVFPMTKWNYRMIVLEKR